MSAEPSIFAMVREKMDAAGPVAFDGEIDRDRYRVARLIRELTQGFVVGQIGPDRLLKVSALLERALVEIDAPGGPAGRRFDRNPLIGKANPVAPPLTMWIEAGRVVGNVTFGPQYQGPPGSVHGGFVAALLDEILGGAQILSGRAGMTGSMTVRYLRPTPLNVQLNVDATLERTDGRKLFVSGRCRHSGILTATADAVFVTVDESRFGIGAAEESTGGGT